MHTRLVTSPSTRGVRATRQEAPSAVTVKEMAAPWLWAKLTSRATRTRSFPPPGRAYTVSRRSRPRSISSTRQVLSAPSGCRAAPSASSSTRWLEVMFSMVWLSSA